MTPDLAILKRRTTRDCPQLSSQSFRDNHRSQQLRLAAAVAYSMQETVAAHADALSLLAVVASAWLALELLFYVMVKHVLLPRLQPLTKPPAYPVQARKLMTKVLDAMDTLSSYDIRRFVEMWFMGAPMEQVYEDNMRSFLAWSMFATHLPQLTPTQREEVDDIVEQLSTRYGVKFHPGFNPAVTHNKMTLDEIPVIHRPLFLYIGIAVSDSFAHFMLGMMGFQRLEFKGTTYHYRAPASARESGLPVTIFHGICSGWIAYLSLIYEYCRDRNRPILLVDYPFITMKMRFDVQPPEVFVERVCGILEKHRIARTAVVGHSYGTVLATWLVHARPDVVAQLTLMDAVCLLLALPEVAYNFLHRPPKTLHEWVIFVLASREISISHVLRRHFWWYKNILWLDEVDCPLIVFIPGGDEVANPTAVYDYVINYTKTRSEQLQHEIAVVFEHGFHHAQILWSNQSIKQLVRTFAKQEKAILADRRLSEQ